MDADELQREKDRAYHAIGRYIFAFSHLVATMRTTMERRLVRPGDPIALIQTGFHDAPAASIANAFFGICKNLGDIQAGTAEHDIWTVLYTDVVQKKIPQRNAMAHADWFVGSIRLGSEGTTPRFLRTTAKTGAGAVVTDMPVADLEARAVALLQLAGTVEEFGLICFKQHPLLGSTPSYPDLSVTDIFVLRGKGDKRSVHREGPLKDATINGFPAALAFQTRPG